MGALLFSKSNRENNNDLFCSYSLGDSWIIEKINEGKSVPKQLEENSTIEPNVPIHCRDGALCQFDKEGQIIRLGGNSIFEYNDVGVVLNLSRGSMLICQKEISRITIKSDISTLHVMGKFTAIVDCTTNGGFKFIPLEGKGNIIPQNGEHKDIYRGRLTMVLGSPSKLGNAYDIDLLLLLKSSRLINSFPTPLPSMKRISLSIYAQQLQLKGKFNALIGDATSEDNLQMWAFGEDESK